MPPLKRKFFSALWHLKQAAHAGYASARTFLTQVLTEKYWLLDYSPTLKKTPPALLLVKLDLIGDFILWLDAAKVYKALYPNHQITLAVNQSCLALAQTLPYWDAVIGFDIPQLRANEAYRVKVLYQLRRGNFSVAIQPTYSREFVGDLVVRATNAQQRIGYVGDLNNIVEDSKKITDQWYTQLIENNPLCVMELNIHAHFVRALGMTGFSSSLPSLLPTIKLSPALTFLPPYIVLAPGASWHPKMWPVGHFATLAGQLQARFNVPILLCGGPGDEGVCSDLVALNRQGNFHNLAGKTTLLETIEVIRHAALLVSNDSSPSHIATATQTPFVCILGGGHFERFLPYRPEQTKAAPESIIATHKMACFGCSWNCIYNLEAGQAVPCIANVSVAAVYQACIRILSQSATVH